jgi:DNA topoisomerase II
MLDGEEPKMMHPWYKNFRGTIEGFGDKYVISGEAAILPNDKIEITELPVGVWTQNYKENVLEPMLGTDKVKPLISEYRVSSRLHLIEDDMNMTSMNEIRT